MQCKWQGSLQLKLVEAVILSTYRTSGTWLVPSSIYFDPRLFNGSLKTTHEWGRAPVSGTDWAVC